MARAEPFRLSRPICLPPSSRTSTKVGAAEVRFGGGIEFGCHGRCVGCDEAGCQPRFPIEAKADVVVAPLAQTPVGVDKADAEGLAVGDEA